MQTEISVKEYARQKGVSLKAVYDQLAVGRVPGARKVGREWRIPVRKETEVRRGSVPEVRE